MINNTNRIIPYNKQIDGLRFVAIFSVLVGHFFPIEGGFLERIPFGSGVNLFFVISGFLITKILLKNKESIASEKTSFIKVIKAFYFKRTLRIFPIYYLSIIILLIINFQNINEIWVWLVTYSTNVYISMNNESIGAFNHLWSLAVEEQFYIIWPMLILLSPRKYIGKIIIAIIMFSLLFKIYYFYTYGWSVIINASTISCADSLGFGALIAYWSMYNKKVINKLSSYWWLTFISAIPFILFVILSKNFEFIRIAAGNFLFSVFAFFIIIRASQENFSFVAKYILENSIIVHIGRISYGIYLYHLFMPELYEYLLDVFPNFIPTEYRYRIPAYFILSFVFAEASWLILEKPLLKFKFLVKYF